MLNPMLVNKDFLTWLLILINKLSLNMLNCFEDYIRCMHISYHILDCVQHNKTKLTMEQPYMMPILPCQYHAYWCPSDIRSQGISRHGIDQISRNIPSQVKIYSSSYLIKRWFPVLNFYLNWTRRQKFAIITDFCQVKLSQNIDI